MGASVSFSSVVLFDCMFSEDATVWVTIPCGFHIQAAVLAEMPDEMILPDIRLSRSCICTARALLLSMEATPFLSLSQPHLDLLQIYMSC